MTPRDFCFWLQGYFELQRKGPTPHGAMDPAQVTAIEEHLKLVFKHESEVTSQHRQPHMISMPVQTVTSPKDIIDKLRSPEGGSVIC